MQWDKVRSLYEHELREGNNGSPCTNVFVHSEAGEERWKDFANRVVEHVRIFTKVYKRKFFTFEL